MLELIVAKPTQEKEILVSPQIENIDELNREEVTQATEDFVSIMKAFKLEKLSFQYDSESGYIDLQSYPKEETRENELKKSMINFSITTKVSGMSIDMTEFKEYIHDETYFFEY